MIRSRILAGSLMLGVIIPATAFGQQPDDGRLGAVRIESAIFGIGGSLLGGIAGWQSGVWFSAQAGIDRTGEDPGLILGGIGALAGSTLGAGLATTFVDLVGGRSTTLERQLTYAALGSALGVVAFAVTGRATGDHQFALVSYSLVQGFVTALGARRARSGR